MLFLVRKLMLPAMVGAAVFGPILYFEGGQWRETLGGMGQWFEEGGKSDGESASNSPPGFNFQSARFGAAGGSGNAPADPSPWGGVPEHNSPARSATDSESRLEFPSFLRFDVTPDWVTRRFSRVSRFPALNEWTGMRTPLVTGTQIDDLTGSLTYYFDQRHQVQRIEVTGYCGTAQKLTAFVRQYYRMQPHPDRQGIYWLTWSGKPVSGLLIRQDGIVSHDNPRQTYEIQLELNRPLKGMSMSERFLSQLPPTKTRRKLFGMR